MKDFDRYEDEVSLRDLYLLLRKGLPLILGVALLAGGVSYVISSVLPKVYEAESTTLVSPSPVQIQNAQNITFRPGNDVSFEAYETLARSRPVAEAVVAAVPEAEREATGFGGRLTMLIGPQRPDQNVPMSVAHAVRHRDPALAAQLADAWALATLEAVQSSLLASLEPVRTTTREETERLAGTLGEVEERYRTFQTGDEGSSLEARLAGLDLLVTSTQETRSILSRDLATARSQLTLLLETETANGPTLGAPNLAALLALSQEQDVSEANSTGERVQDTQRMQDVNALQAALDLAGGEVDVVALLNRVDLHNLAVDIAGFEAALKEVETQLAQYEQDAQTLRARIADLDLERTRLERERQNAQQAYEDVAMLEPIISYVTEITPANTRLLNSASVPVGPAGPRRLLNVALAVAVATGLMILFVLLREAVKPSDSRERATSG